MPLQDSLRALDTKYKTKRAVTPTEPWEYEAAVKGLLSSRAAAAIDRDKIELQNTKEQEQFDKTLAQNKALYDAQMDQAEKNAEAIADAQQSEAMSNIGTTVLTDYMKSKKGESIVEKGYELGKTGYNDLFGDTAAATTATNTTPAATPLSAAVSEEAIGDAASGMEGVYSSTAPAETTAEGATTVGAGVAADTGATAASFSAGSLASILASKVLPYYGMAKMGGKIINSITGNNPWMKDTPFGLLGTTLKDPFNVEGSIANKLADKGVGNEDVNEYLLSSANPLEVGGWTHDFEDKALNTATGGLYTPAKEVIEEVEDACIIVTACTDRYSPEVEITRQYRDCFLKGYQLRGYYALAEKVVPVLQKSIKANKAVKKYLVDRLIEYGSYRLGFGKAPKVLSYVVSKAFLSVISLIGIVIRKYTRKNGEVY